jgi:hypothetical protein
MNMPDFNLTTLCSDFVVSHFPDTEGLELADIMCMAIDEAEAFVCESLSNVTHGEIRNHLRSYFDAEDISQGYSGRVARTNYYRELCLHWAQSLNAGDMFDGELGFAVDVAVSDARMQMDDGVWPEAEAGRLRMHWIL